MKYKLCPIFSTCKNFFKINLTELPLSGNIIFTDPVSSDLKLERSPMRT